MFFLDLWPKWCWKRTNVLVKSEQSLHEIKVFHYFSNCSARDQAGVQKEFRGDTAKIADPS